MSSSYDCCIGLDTIENYLILRAMILTYIYGISFTTPARVVALVPRWASRLPTLWPIYRCIPWQKCSLWWRWLNTVAFWSPVSNLVAFGASGIPCGAVWSSSWMLLWQCWQSLEDPDSMWPSPLWLVQAPQCLSWQIVSTGLELWETCSWACWMAKWFTAISVSSLEGVLKDSGISLSKNFISWW